MKGKMGGNDAPRMLGGEIYANLGLMVCQRILAHLQISLRTASEAVRSFGYRDLNRILRKRLP